MSESKRKKAIEQEIEKITKELVDKGSLIQGGFAIYVIISKIDIKDPALPRLYDAYMSGAQHLWASIFTALDPGSKETPADMRRMEKIQNELNRWHAHKKAELDKAAKESAPK